MSEAIASQAERASPRSGIALRRMDGRWAARRAAAWPQGAHARSAGHRRASRCRTIASSSSKGRAALTVSEALKPIALRERPRLPRARRGVEDVQSTSQVLLRFRPDFRWRSSPSRRRWGRSHPCAAIDSRRSSDRGLDARLRDRSMRASPQIVTDFTDVLAGTTIGVVVGGGCRGSFIVRRRRRPSSAGQAPARRRRCAAAASSPSALRSDRVGLCDAVVHLPPRRADRKFAR